MAWKTLKFISLARLFMRSQRHGTDISGSGVGCKPSTLVHTFRQSDSVHFMFVNPRTNSEKALIPGTVHSREVRQFYCIQLALYPQTTVN